MKYVKRILIIIAAFLAGIIAIPLVVFDIMCIAAYYFWTGGYYGDKFYPLLFSVITFCMGDGWHWRYDKSKGEKYQ